VQGRGGEVDRGRPDADGIARTSRFVSAVTGWEIEIKRGLGKIDVGSPSGFPQPDHLELYFPTPGEPLERRNPLRVAHLRERRGWRM
jgi:hypothetical protein